MNCNKLKCNGTHTCESCSNEINCQEDMAYFEEWAHVKGDLVLGHQEWSNTYVDFCSDVCIIRWLGRNYYLDGVGSTWIKTEEEMIDLGEDE